MSSGNIPDFGGLFCHSDNLTDETDIEIQSKDNAINVTPLPKDPRIQFRNRYQSSIPRSEITQ